jgi:peptidoglycan hydrolase-like protein with peptidoglycan-binding domain
VVDTPASTREVDVPAEYRTVKVAKLVEDAKESSVEVPAQYTTLRKTVKVADATSEWRSILCETNATPDRIKNIQLALKEEGFDPGPIDGKIKRKTMNAVNAFQAAQKLPVDQYLNIDTVKALGVKPS